MRCGIDVDDVAMLMMVVTQHHAGDVLRNERVHVDVFRFGIRNRTAYC